VASLKNLMGHAVDRLPWGLRKLVRRLTSFIVIHGFSALFVAKPTFRGIYPSFSEVGSSIDAVKPELAKAAVDTLMATRSDSATGLPLLDQHRELLPLTVAVLTSRGRPLNILDFGGGAGVDFGNVLNSLPSADLTYCVVDLPEVCDRARPLWSGESRISFRSSLPEQAAFDLVYSWSALQYVPEPLRLLHRFTQYRPRAILIVGSPFTSGKAFVREQLNRSKPFPQWVLSLPEVTDVLDSCGYQLAFRAVHEHDYNVDGYAAAYRVPNSTSLLFLSNDR
jgi:putative methyltransferase (TIGR04325 family)